MSEPTDRYGEAVRRKGMTNEQLKTGSKPDVEGLPVRDRNPFIRTEQDLLRDAQEFSRIFIEDFTPQQRLAYVESRAQTLDPYNPLHARFLQEAMRSSNAFTDQFSQALTGTVQKLYPQWKDFSHQQDMSQEARYRFWATIAGTKKLVEMLPQEKAQAIDLDLQTRVRKWWYSQAQNAGNYAEVARHETNLYRSYSAYLSLWEFLEGMGINVETEEQETKREGVSLYKYHAPIIDHKHINAIIESPEFRVIDKALSTYRPDNYINSELKQTGYDDETKRTLTQIADEVFSQVWTGTTPDRQRFIKQTVDSLIGGLVEKEFAYSREETPYYFDFDYTLPSWISASGEFDLKKFRPEYFYFPRGDQYELTTNPGKKIENPYDLRNLRFIDPNMVVEAVEKIISFAKTSNKPIVCAIATGGTIASEMVGQTLKAGVSMDKILAYTGWDIPRDYNVAAIALPNLIDSSQMKQDYDADIAIAVSYITNKVITYDEASIAGNFFGFAVSHGTDTMAQSATRVAMMLGPYIPFPVGFVGSQESKESVTNEIPANIRNCFTTLSRVDESKGFVFVSMGGTSGQVFNPCGLKKESDTDILGFSSKAIGPILEFGDIVKSKRSLNTPFQDKYTRAHDPDEVTIPRIVRGTDQAFEMKAEMGVKEGTYRGIIRSLDPEIKVLILETYGSFTFDSRDVDEIIAAAKRKGLTVLAANPFPTGLIDHAYDASQYLIAQGALPIHMLPHAAMAKLKVLEAEFPDTTEGREKIREALLTTSRVGEQPPSWVPKDMSGNWIEKPELVKKHLGVPEEVKQTKQVVLYP